MCLDTTHFIVYNTHMTNEERIPDSVHLRSIAQNDYNIDGNLLPDGVLLYEIAERMERTEALLREQTHKAIEAAFALREAKRDRDEARREFCLWKGAVKGIPREKIAEEQGWDCFVTQKREEAMDRLAQLDEEIGL